MSTYAMTANPSRAQVARQDARARCARDGGQQYLVSATTPAGKRIEQIEPSEYDRDRLIFDLQHNGYTNIEHGPVNS